MTHNNEFHGDVYILHIDHVVVPILVWIHLYLATASLITWA